MEIYKSVYWKLPVFLLKIVGLWPFYHDPYKYLKRAAIYLSGFLTLIPTLLKMYLEIGRNTPIVLECIVALIYVISIFLKTSIAIMNLEKHKRIYLMISNDWEKTTDEVEIEILHKYSKIGLDNGLTYFGIAMGSVFLFFCLPLTNQMLDFFSPLENGTRPLELPYFAEFYIDQEKYFYLLYLEMAITGVETLIVYISYDIVFSYSVQHICSLFEIINLRLQKVSKLRVQMATEYNQPMDQNYKKKIKTVIIKVIQLHQTVIENVTVVEDTYNLTWLMELMLNSILIGFSIFILLTKLRMYKELFRQGLFFMMVLIHQYFIFLAGQKVIDASVNVIDTCYSCEWYDLSSEAKTLIKIVMARCIRPLELSGGKIFSLSMNTYSNMLRSGLSYFTMLANTSD